MEQLVHGTCVALGNSCALLRGPSGAGKSDLALRFLFIPGENLNDCIGLIADDQVLLRKEGAKVIASCPQALAGKLEVRGLGIATVPARPSAELVLIVDLDGKAGWQRSPDCEERETILGVRVLRVSLDPFEGSAPLKLALLLRNELRASLN